MQSNRLRHEGICHEKQQRQISILCSHADCDVYNGNKAVSILCIPYRLLLVFPVLRPVRTLFQSSAVHQTALLLLDNYISAPLVTSTLYILLQLESTCLRSYRIPERLWQPFPHSRCTLKCVELALADCRFLHATTRYPCCR